MIDSVVCAVEGFELLLGSQELGAGDSAVMSIGFRPQRVGGIAGRAAIYHNAGSGVTWISLEGEGRE